ncbi:MAG TPA: class I SAM-dependent methyltransferase [Polyangiaceae bacterium]|nr:class I SAM-dependent methyltransferase [Polyangiaceae bacterium]
MTRDRELEAGSLAHYEDPAYYTATYARRIDDVAYYVALAGKARGPVLEYGIGNGRVALPIARHGVEVVGVDHSRPMLADLRDRLAKEPASVRSRVSAVRGDMRRVRLGRRFPLVLATFNTALHLYTRQDVEGFFARVREHLAPRGRFVADLSVPSVAELARDPSRPFHAPRFLHPTAQVRVKNRERFDYDPIRQVLFVSMEFEPVDDPSGGWMTPLAHRQFFPREWEALLHYGGFDVEQVHGDFAGGPLTADSDVMVWHARRRRR